MTGSRVAMGCVALVCAGVAVAQVAPIPFTHSISPRGFAEECFRLTGGATIGYRFEASAPVDFNIHFHRGKDVEYPVKRVDVRVADEPFTAPSTEEYCLMWSNRTGANVTVGGRLAP